MVLDTSITNASHMTSQAELNQLQTFSDINDMLASEIVKQYMNGQPDTSQFVTPKPKVDIPLKTYEEPHGFSLQPITALVSDSDDSPPTDSLKSIKSIAEERKRRFMGAKSQPKSKQRTKSAPTPNTPKNYSSNLPRKGAKKNVMESTPRKRKIFFRRKS